jgi:hypothetical protein
MKELAVEHGYRNATLNLVSERPTSRSRSDCQVLSRGPRLEPVLELVGSSHGVRVGTFVMGIARCFASSSALATNRVVVDLPEPMMPSMTTSP